jgi:phosphatidylglycerol:prolipoprotein diacylglycerol transferase
MILPAPDIHASYAGLMLVSVALVLAVPTTAQFTQRADRARYYTMQAITAISALLGAKLAVVLGDALWPLRPFDDWAALMASGRSIVGALLFGFLAVEGAKPLLGYDIPPNDRFAVVLPFSIGIGRIGCLLAGCCRGAPYEGPLAIAYDDHVLRHPAQMYEVLFQLAAGWLLLRLWRRGTLFGRLFALYLVIYGVFRFLTEFIRETAKPYDGLSAYQLMCVAMAVAGAAALYARASHRQPASWNRWKNLQGAST